MKIAGSDINIDHADIKGKNIQDLKKLDIFSHLSKEDQDKAYTELYNATSIKYGPVIKTTFADVQKADEDLDKDK